MHLTALLPKFRNERTNVMKICSLHLMEFDHLCNLKVGWLNTAVDAFLYLHISENPEPAEVRDY